MALSVYVHIPYCIQRCRYCDFTTFEWSEILPPERYVDILLQEIRLRREFWPQTEIATLYFGGGTPSLIAPELIVSICRELANSGFTIQPQAEVTIEINPATLTSEKLATYQAAGVNRFSVGAQSFNDELLKTCGRRHTAADTRQTLKLLHGQNYSFDLLFALPGQTRADLERDLAEVAEFAPAHLSAYLLTIPSGHPMSFGRPPEEQQVEMFELIEEQLELQGLVKYEISNFARPGFESQHNSVYWRDESYWGLGLSSHSYDRDGGPFGMRFWNPKSLKTYADQCPLKGQSFKDVLPLDQLERLKQHEALTDFCHMHLRTLRGLPLDALHKKFGELVAQRVEKRLFALAVSGWLEKSDGFFRLTRSGQMLSNKVFEELTFLPRELESSN